MLVWLYFAFGNHFCSSFPNWDAALFAFMPCLFLLCKLFVHVRGNNFLIALTSNTCVRLFVFECPPILPRNPPPSDVSTLWKVPCGGVITWNLSAYAVYLLAHSLVETNTCLTMIITHLLLELENYSSTITLTIFTSSCCKFSHSSTHWGNRLMIALNQ